MTAACDSSLYVPESDVVLSADELVIGPPCLTSAALGKTHITAYVDEKKTLWFKEIGEDLANAQHGGM